MADSIETNGKNEPVERVWKKRPGEVDFRTYKETDIERLMYEALQDYAYHTRCAQKVNQQFINLREAGDPEWITFERHLKHHQEQVEQARDRIRRYAKRLSPA